MPIEMSDVSVTNVRTSASLNELFAALAKAQGEIKNAVKDSTNPHFKTSYADLASTREAGREQLSKNGLCVIQLPFSNGADIGVTTMMGHASGQWIRGDFSVKPMKYDAQGAGSVVTYLRRYSLAAITGVAPGDDDGEGAAGRDGGGGPGLSAPSRPSEGKAVKTASPTANDDAHRAVAEAIKMSIDIATNVLELNLAMAANGQAVDKTEPDPKLALGIVKSNSLAAYEFLIDRANKKRAALSQRPAA